MLWAARDYERAGRYRRDALEVARAIGDPSLLAHSLNRVGNWYVNREDPHSGIPHHDEALAIFERADDRRGVAETVDLLAMAHHIAGREDAAVHAYDRAVALFTALEDRRGLANALAVLSVCGPSHHASAGPVLSSIDMPDLLTDERAVRLATEIGWRAGEAFSRCLLADSFAWRGEYERSLRRARESLAIAEEIEHLEWQCGARRVLGVVALDLCAMDEPAHTAARGGTRHCPTPRVGHVDSLDRRAAGDCPRARWTTGTGRDASRRGRPHRYGANAGTGYAAEGAPRTLGQRHWRSHGPTLRRRRRAGGGARCDRERDTSGTPRAGLLRGHALAAQGRWAEATTCLASRGSTRAGRALVRFFGVLTRCREPSTWVSATVSTHDSRSTRRDRRPLYLCRGLDETPFLRPSGRRRSVGTAAARTHVRPGGEGCVRRAHSARTRHGGAGRPGEVESGHCAHPRDWRAHGGRLRRGMPVQTRLLLEVADCRLGGRKQGLTDTESSTGRPRR